jgi:hypothetical protein
MNHPQTELLTETIFNLEGELGGAMIRHFYGLTTLLKKLLWV